MLLPENCIKEYKYANHYRNRILIKKIEVITAWRGCTVKFNRETHEYEITGTERAIELCKEDLKKLHKGQ